LFLQSFSGRSKFAYPGNQLGTNGLQSLSIIFDLTLKLSQLLLLR
jgi:hypothetical protein